MPQPFHLAFPVKSLMETRAFFHDVLGCPLGRESPEWIDFDFYGHQITAHLKPEACSNALANEVDGDQVPVRHFGVILEWSEWEALSQKLQARGWPFHISPKIRFHNQPGEQGTFFIRDPSGNILEFKTFKSHTNIFTRGE